ncbi:protein lethal(2) giant larvae-like, partial [Tropilaelaps mercedesae]
MFKFITGRRGYTFEKAKIVKELFAFSRTASHGFPHSPSCLAIDEDLSLLCICTRAGTVRVYGCPGVEFVAYHPAEGSVTQAHFISGQGRLVTLGENNELILWEIVDTQLEPVESILNFEKRIFTICVTPNKKKIFLGTEQGDVHVLDADTFKLTDIVVQRDLITEKVCDDFKVSPGGVECIRCLSEDQCIIGYQRGILVLFDFPKLSAKQTYISRKDLSSIYIIDDSKFVSCHTDGGYAVWSTILSSSTKHADQIYGPHPCKAIDKLYAFDNERTLIFTGGMPRAQYGDKYTLSVHRGPIERKVFEFTSKVIDFYVVAKKVIVALAEEELVAINLHDLKQIPLPYLFPLHCSAITNVIHASAVPQEVVTKLTDGFNEDDWSTASWPITGGKLPEKDDKEQRNEKETESDNCDLILTGHEDGSVRIYDATGVAMKLLACIRTSLVFNERCHEASRSVDQDEDEFLQFTKVGSFDPFSDDPRFAVKKLAFNSESGTLVVGGTAGQVLVLGLEEKRNVKVVTLNLVGDRDQFVWKGHDELNYDPEGCLKSNYHVRCVVQVTPPAGLTALAISEKWSLISAGTAHGFGCVDLSCEEVVMFKCTLSVTDLGGAGAHSGDMVRRKSFKKSLRESFRRLRKGRSQRGKTAKNLEDVKPVERQVESRIMQDDGLSSMVRSLVFSDAYILSHATTSRTFWASTNQGSVYVYTLKRSGDDNQTTMSLCKEIHLRHHAPVLGIFVVDSHGYLCHDAPPKENPVPNLWRVVICSEEQIKVFSLPQLKPLHKVKLTANEGSRLRKLQVAEFRNAERSEYCLVVLTNQGQVMVFSLPDLRRIITANCCRKDDINGISSAVFTPQAEGFHLNSASELDRVSVSATKMTAPTGLLELDDDARSKRKRSLRKKGDVKEKEVVKETVKERRSSTPEKRRGATPERKERKTTASENKEKEIIESKERKDSAENDRKTDTKETHEKREQQSVAVEKTEDGRGERRVETEQVAEKKIKQQVEECEGFKVESVEVIVTKKAVVVAEETQVVNGRDFESIGRIVGNLSKEVTGGFEDLESPNTGLGISSVAEEIKSFEVSSATDAEDSTIVIERNQEQQQQLESFELYATSQTEVTYEEQKVTEKIEKRAVKVMEHTTGSKQECCSSLQSQTAKK